MSVRTGTAVLTNSRKYPFHDTGQMILLDPPAGSREYHVSVTVLAADGDPGQIRITDRARNAFRAEYTGSAGEVEISWSAEEAEL